MIIFIFNSRQCKVIYRDRKWISGCLGEKAGGEEGRIIKGHRGTFSVLEIFVL